MPGDTVKDEPDGDSTSSRTTGATTLVVRYAKRGRLRFASHRDVARTFERAVRRSDLPVAYSQGFTPHPKLSWVGAAPTGAASEAEYVEIALSLPADPDHAGRLLDDALPTDLAVVSVTDGTARGQGLGTIDASRWRIEVPGVDPQQLRVAVAELMAAAEVSIERVMKNGPRQLDARAAIVSLDVLVPPQDDTAALAGSDHVVEYGILDAVVRHVSPAVRPDDVLGALSVVSGLRLPAPAKAIRVAQGRLDDGEIVDPLAVDRVADPAQYRDSDMRRDSGGVA